MDELDEVMVGVRVDSAGFAREVAAMRASLDGVLGAGGARAGHAIEASLLRAVRTGKLGFEELKATALSVLEGIAEAAIRTGIRALLGQVGQPPGGGIGGGGGGLLAGLLGVPGRATGGPVAPGRAYRVGERGPELFVPTSAGRVETGPSMPRDVRVSITVRGGGGDAAGVLAKSGRQVARAVKAALEE